MVDIPDTFNESVELESKVVDTLDLVIRLKLLCYFIINILSIVLWFMSHLE